MTTVINKSELEKMKKRGWITLDHPTLEQFEEVLKELGWVEIPSFPMTKCYKASKSFGTIYATSPGHVATETTPGAYPINGYNVACFYIGMSCGVKMSYTSDDNENYSSERWLESNRYTVTDSFIAI